MTELIPFAALLLGFAGSGHCVAMCGGIAGALERGDLGDALPRAARLTLYAVGRVGSYALLGALAGGLGVALGTFLGPEWTPLVSRGTRAALGASLVIFALVLVGRVRLVRLEQLGSRVWRRLLPLTRRVRSAPPALACVGVGALWGFLPCGLVYGALGMAVLSGSTLHGALWMAAFGIGTIPAVLGVGAMAGQIWPRLGGRNARGATAAALALCGLWILFGPELVGSAMHAHH